MTTLPATALDALDWSWAEFAPVYDELAARALSADNVTAWLRDWTALGNLVSEVYSRLYVATTCDTANQEAEGRFHRFLNDVYPGAMAAEQRLKQKLLDSGLEPDGFALPLRNMRAEAALFREANLPLLTEERKLANAYNKISGAQTVTWEGQELTIAQLEPVYQHPDRGLREQAWRLAATRQLADREAINTLWQQFMGLRKQLAANAGFPDYRAFRWQQMLRFDYSPDDCAQFREAIAELVVPAAQRIYERRRQQLGLTALRPWDLAVDPLGRPALRPFSRGTELEAQTAAMLDRVDPELGGYFGIMRREGLLDLENRKNKGPGGYCTSFDMAKRPFIFMNAVGLPDNVRTLLHEAGHAFHVFETAALPYQQQRDVPMEFAEVASMAMELLSSPYLPSTEGGFYSQVDAARARVDHLEHILLFWPYMAVVDAFQHWVYTNHEAASEPANCDATWAELWQRFMPGVDWSGLEQEMMTGWQRKQHIHRNPFYYIEYGLAQLGAVLVWRNALADQSGAVVRYRAALALGGTATLPDLYTAAGARLAFDAATLRDAVELLETRIAMDDYSKAEG